MHFTADNEPCFLGNSRTIKKQVGALEHLSYLLQKGSKFQSRHVKSSTFFFVKILQVFIQEINNTELFEGQNFLFSSLESVE